jgi:hypothetical protein
MAEDLAIIKKQEKKGRKKKKEKKRKGKVSNYNYQKMQEP